MTYQERIDAKANEIELLTAYANGVTGAEDTNIGDAIKTLCDGYGHGEEETVYTSSTGVPYTETMCIVVANGTNSLKVINALDNYGEMPSLKKLILTGRFSNEPSGAILNSAGYFSATRYPKLEELVIAPDYVYTNATVNNYFKLSHYTFSGTNLKRLVLGSLGRTYITESGYYRNDMPVPPFENKYVIGSPDGLEMVIYTDVYRPTAGFINKLAPNTTLIQYDYLTGELLEE